MQNLFLAFFALVILGCSGTKNYPASRYANHQAETQDQEVGQVFLFDDSPAPSPQRAKQASSKIGFQKLENMGFAENAEGVFMLDEDPKQIPNTKTPEAEEESERKVYYHGDIRSRQLEPQAYLDSIGEQVKEMGGRIEFRSKYRLTLRVPVDSFRTYFEKLKGIGQVESYNMSAQDVSFQFQDTELRKKLAEKTIEKLKELISKAQNEKEKLRLLRELQRVSEELEHLDAQLQTIKDLADFSRLELYAQPFSNQNSSSTVKLGAFDWIQNLNPFRFTTSIRESAPVILEKSPKGFVQIEREKKALYVAPEGAKYWIQEMRNNPMGDNLFWANAIESYLLPQYRNTGKTTLKNFSYYRMESRDLEPYVYWVGILTNGEKLQLIQIWFPDSGLESKYESVLKESLEALQ